MSAHAQHLNAMSAVGPAHHPHAHPHGHSHGHHPHGHYAQAAAALSSASNASTSSQPSGPASSSANGAGAGSGDKRDGPSASSSAAPGGLHHLPHSHLHSLHVQNGSQQSTGSTDLGIEKQGEVDLKEYTQQPNVAKLFIGQVPGHMNEQDLRKLFEQYGNVMETVVLRDKYSGQHSGCAFVTYATSEEADKAVDALHDKVSLHPGKRNLVVRYAGQSNQPQDWKLFVGMLARTTSEERIRQIFSEYGEVKEVYLMRDPSGVSKGCAFVKYDNRDSAVAAIGALHELYQDEQAPRNLVVKFAEKKSEKLHKLARQPRPGFPGFPPQYPGFPGNFNGNMGFMGSMPMPFAGQPAPSAGPSGPSGPAQQRPGFPPNMQQNFNGFPPPGAGPFTRGGPQARGGGQRGPPGANLFIYNIPEQFSDHDLTTLFSHFGTVLSAKVYMDKQTGHNRGFGFVSYGNPHEAAMAIQNMNGYEINNRKLKVSPKKGPDSAAAMQAGPGPAPQAQQLPPNQQLPQHQPGFKPF